MVQFNIALASKLLRQRAFTYTEVLVSVLLMVALLVPALRALQSGIAGANDGTLGRQMKLRAMMETVLARPFADLYDETYKAGGNTLTSISNKFSDAPGTDRRVVVLYRYDATAKALSANDTGLLFISVSYEDDAGVGTLSTLLGRWW